MSQAEQHQDPRHLSLQPLLQPWLRLAWLQYPCWLQALQLPRLLPRRAWTLPWPCLLQALLHRPLQRPACLPLPWPSLGQTAILPSQAWLCRISPLQMLCWRRMLAWRAFWEGLQHRGPWQLRMRTLGGMLRQPLQQGSAEYHCGVVAGRQARPHLGQASTGCHGRVQHCGQLAHERKSLISAEHERHCACGRCEATASVHRATSPFQAGNSSHPQVAWELRRKQVWRKAWKRAWARWILAWMALQAGQGLRGCPVCWVTVPCPLWGSLPTIPTFKPLNDPGTQNPWQCFKSKLAFPSPRSTTAHARRFPCFCCWLPPSLLSALSSQPARLSTARPPAIVPSFKATF